MAGIHLDDYQLDAVKRMHNGCILCGGVGSGKSRTALAYYYLLNGGSFDNPTGEDAYYPMNDPPMDLYIITTARKRDTLEWEAEMVPFLLYTNKENNLYSNKVMVDSWNNIGKYTDVKRAFFIFDEQRVVGSGAWVKTFLKLSHFNQWILLSATPGDTWSDYIPVFIANGYYRNRTEFNREHVIYKRFTKFPMIDRYINTGRLIRQRREILVTMDYQNKVVKHHEDVFVNFDMEAYNKARRDRWNPFSNKPIENAGEYCYVLRRIINSSDSRQIAVLELFEQHPKLIIFYNFDYELEILHNLFSRFDGLTVAEWNGHKHEKLPEGGSWIYLVQYNAGAEAWNCITTDAMVFYSQSYSYKTMEQSAGRIDRRNTPYKELWYYHLRSQKGIDLAIHHSLTAKKNFNIGAYAGKYFEKTKKEITNGDQHS